MILEKSVKGILHRLRTVYLWRLFLLGKGRVRSGQRGGKKGKERVRRGRGLLTKGMSGDQNGYKEHEGRSKPSLSEK